MNYSPENVQAHPVRQEHTFEAPDGKKFQLTVEELEVLRKCKEEGIYKRAIPMGVLFGLSGMFGAKAGFLRHSRLGHVPATLGFGMLGFLIGRLTYGKVCLQRVLDVPDGNLRKMLPQLKQKETIENDAFYVAIDTPKSQDSDHPTQTSGTDIDVQSTSNFDTIPSDYYKESPEDLREELIPKNYTSYDDLRRRNRQEYTNKMYPEINPSQPRYPGRPDDGPIIRRPAPQDVSPVPPTGGQQTKYGDTWDV